MVKICGIKNIEEAGWVCRAGADFLGMVLFYPKSKRNINTETAAKIISEIHDMDSSVKTVAVMVSPTSDQALAAKNAGFDYLQVHGRLEEGVLEAGLPVLKAFNVSDVSDYEKYSGCDNIAGFVFDANVPGSGKSFDYEVMEKACVRPIPGKIFLLAGGLSPDNVAEALKVTGFPGADTSSGVENEDGTGKSREKIIEFVRNANL